MGPSKNSLRAPLSCQSSVPRGPNNLKKDSVTGCSPHKVLPLVGAQPERSSENLKKGPFDVIKCPSDGLRGIVGHPRSGVVHDRGNCWTPALPLGGIDNFRLHGGLPNPLLLRKSSATLELIPDCSLGEPESDPRVGFSCQLTASD